MYQYMFTNDVSIGSFHIPQSSSLYQRHLGKLCCKNIRFADNVSQLVLAKSGEQVIKLSFYFSNLINMYKTYCGVFVRDSFAC